MNVKYFLDRDDKFNLKFKTLKFEQLEMDI